MAVNIEDLKLEEITEEFLQDEMIDMGAELNVDTRQGSIYRDAGEGHAFRTAKFFNDLRQIVGMISIYSATGRMLDEHMAMRVMKRNPPQDTPATYFVEYIGAYPDEGARMICGGYFFRAKLLNNTWVIESEQTGTQMNSISPGTAVIPERDVAGLKSATVIGIAVPALDRESDDDARTRLINSLSGPDENANISHLRTWCESVAGVGRARIIPLWAGPDTALGIIVAKDGRAPTKAVVDAVQEYVDPGAEGMGEGKATIGCHFTAIGAEMVVIDVSARILRDSTGNNLAIEEAFESSLKQYLARLALASVSKDSSVVVRYANIFAQVMQLDGVVDCQELLLNGGQANITCTIYQVPVLGEVEILYD